MKSHDAVDRADEEVAAYGATTLVLLIVAAVFLLRKNPAIGILLLAASMISHLLAMRAAARLNHQDPAQPETSTLNGRLDIKRSSGL